MAADISRARNFLLSSDYPLDKIIYMKSGSFTIAGFSFFDEIFAHNLPFTPLLQGSWSLTPDFSVAYDFGSGPIGGNPLAINTGISATSSQVTVATSNNTASGVTFYYRIYGLEPSDVDFDVPFTNTQADTFSFNSEFNYTKLYLAGVLNQAATPSATQVVTHALGYRPQVLAWQEVSGVISPLLYVDLGSSQVYIEVTTLSAIINFVFSPTMKIHYRVYLDE